MGDKISGPNQRVFPRANRETTAWYQVDEGQYRRCTALDLGIEGACLQLSEPIAEGVGLEVRFEMDEDWMVSATAKTLWVREKDGQFLVGIAYKPLRSYDKNLIGPWIHKIRREAMEGTSLLVHFTGCHSDVDVFDRTLALLVERLSPERALILYGYDSDNKLMPQAALGLNVESVFISGEISTEVLRDTLAQGEGQVVVNAMQDSRFGERNSAVVSGIRSVLCVPLKMGRGRTKGLLYCDNRGRSSAFRSTQLDWLTSLGDAMLRKLAELGG